MISPFGRRNRALRPRGFTFVEIIVATIVMVIAVIPFFSGIQRRNRQARYDKIRSFAMTLASNYLERTRAMRYDYLSGGGTDSGVVGGGADGANELFNSDVIMSPKPGVEGCPTDAEMQALISQWRNRLGSFSARTMPPQRPTGFEASKTVLLGVRVSWGDKREMPKPSGLADLTKGTNHLSLACLAGEALFHPPPDLSVPATPP
ncbi:MAG: hypothetical protein HUU15_04005 [Candidatus Brocadiae bacterium]|nr:hypothetical protein [Candidatus Brocadiia bacterium]